MASKRSLSLGAGSRARMYVSKLSSGIVAYRLTGSGWESQPPSVVFVDQTRLAMDKKSFTPRAVLRINLKALMGAGGPASQMELARKSGVGQATIGRILSPEGVDAGIETVEKIAKAYGMQGWQLLVAGMDPTNPPVLQPVSKAERALYERLRAAADEIAKLKP